MSEDLIGTGSRDYIFNKNVYFKALGLNTVRSLLLVFGFLDGPLMILQEENQFKYKQRYLGIPIYDKYI